jgi:protein O-GlcNAc transferase
MESSERFEQAVLLFRAGQLTHAEHLCSQIIVAEPNFSAAWHLLGHIAFCTGRDDVAEECLGRAIALNPRNAEAHNNLGGVLLRRGALDRAAQCFSRAVELMPGFTAAHVNLAKVLHDQGELEQAIACYRRALELDAAAADVYAGLGNALADSNRLDDAVAAYHGCLQLRPDLANVRNNLGTVLRAQGMLVEAEACFRQALALQPDSAEVHANLGNVLRDLGKLDDAVANYRRAIALKPDFAIAYNNLANALRDQANLDEAVACCRRAIELQPDLYRAHSNLVYTLYFCPQYDAAAIYKEHLTWNKQHAQPLAARIQPHGNDRSSTRRLRVGYMSPDFCKHAQSLFTVPLLSAHDHQQLEIFCYSDVARPDTLTARLQSCVDVWREIGGLADERVAEMVRADEIDILVDLSMHMARGRLLLFARKPAPVQVCWLAYPGTTGLATMDYRLTDSYLDPPNLDDSYYSEKSIRLPDAFWCYDPLTTDPAPNALPALTSGYITFGSLNNFCKLNDSVLRLWAQVFKSVKGSRLLILAHEGSHRQRTLGLLESEGVANDRISFMEIVPRSKYLELYHQIDICLDTFPANGHTTTLDSCWMGVPVVTLLGTTAIGRGAASILQNLGLPELIAKTPDQFVRTARELAGDLPRLSELRSTLRERLKASPLMDAPRFARSMELAYRHMWQRWCNEVRHEVRAS